MNQTERNRLEERIKEEIAKAQEDIARLSEVVNPISPDNAIGRLSRMEAIGARSVNQSALSQAKDRLSGLNHALANLNEPEFGLCFDCGEDIPIKRLLLMPHAKMCVGCAEEADTR